MTASEPQAKNGFIKWKDVNILDGFLGRYQQLCLDVTLPIELEQLQRTGRLNALKGTWKQGMPNKPHFFWDSDVAKWLEAVAYSLAVRPDAELEAKADEIIREIALMQQADGYFNLYYQLVEPGKRFTYLKRMHELYCLGHLIEAAVAYYQATGKEQLLNVVRKYVRLVEKQFGDEGIPGYDGHEEIELALIKLYRLKKEESDLRLAETFIDRHGTFPHFFEQECEKRGEAAEDRKYRDDMQGMYSYYQAHMPLRDQRHAVGHAVRAMYIYCAMQDMANLTGDNGLQEACDSIWQDIVTSQFYLTGGIGPRMIGERFSYAYDLPNEMSYNETCASIGLMMFAARRLGSKRPMGQFGDVMERALYNTVLGAISLDGEKFYYANPLSVLPAAYENMNDPRPQVTVLRQKWFDVACCPPNLARLLTSLGGYMYSKAGDTLYVHLYADSRAHVLLNEESVTVTTQTRYPWEGKICFTMELQSISVFSFALRIPSWSAGNYTVSVNGIPTACTEKDGFASVQRAWKDRDQVILTLDMHLRITQARPEVAADCGRVALERGPIVYCFEEYDNGPQLSDLKLDLRSLEVGEYNADLLGGIVPVYGNAKRRLWKERTLYSEWKEPEMEEVKVTAVPFFARLNRGAGEMAVWLQHL